MNIYEQLAAMPANADDNDLYAIQYSEGEPGAAGVIFQSVVGYRAALIALALDYVIPRLKDMPPQMLDEDEVPEALLEGVLGAEGPEDLAEVASDDLEKIIKGYFEVQDEVPSGGNYCAWYEITKIDLPANFVLPVRLDVLDDAGEVVDSTSVDLSQGAVADIVDNAAQLLLDCDDLSDAEFNKRTFDNMAGELQEALESAGVIGARS